MSAKVVQGILSKLFSISFTQISWDAQKSSSTDTQLKERERLRLQLWKTLTNDNPKDSPFAGDGPWLSVFYWKASLPWFRFYPFYCEVGRHKCCWSKTLSGTQVLMNNSHRLHWYISACKPCWVKVKLRAA
jgi:hypothetical protein